MHGKSVHFLMGKLQFVGATFGRLSNQNKPDKGHFVGVGVLDDPKGLPVYQYNLIT